jgi:hypothetical protein
MDDDSRSKSQSSQSQIIIAVISSLGALGVAVATNWDKIFSTKTSPPSPLPAQTSIQSLPSSPSPAQTSIQSLTPSPAQVAIKPLDKPGLYLASTTLLYSDGDQLKADFRVYCPTSTIRPTKYVLMDRTGTVKKRGTWWEEAFRPKDDSEHQLIEEVCRQQ